ncbi:MAG: hypothetical protein C4527_19550 [Candidatus Omnitrophota bacterium]|jgi:hypothetical protein|nr:MAG: hypothetical protein C4527_19550 [Candidatus Omnitrophota bacterium]
MRHEYITKKRPFLAGFLSLVPGLGQLYNEQKGKGIFLLFIFLVSLFLLVSEGYPLFDRHGEFIFHSGRSSILHEHGIIIPGEPFFINQDTFEEAYPLFWCFLIYPLLVAFSVSDAVSSARKINRKIMAGQATPVVQPAIDPQKTEVKPMAVETILRLLSAQEEIPQKTEVKPMAVETAAEIKMESVNPRQETPITDQSQSESTPPPLPQKNHRHSGKFLFGLILMAIGGMAIMSELNLNIFSWNHLWPLVPLLFGLRLLRDYHQDRDQGQFVLGVMFTIIGGIFFLENWGFARPWRWIEHNWEIALLAAGCVLILQDIVERRKREQR